jgi:hypothetical protein
MKKKFVWISLVVMIALLISSIGVLAAAPSDKPTPGAQSENSQGNKGAKNGKVQNFKGIVTAKSGSELTLTLKDGSVVTLGLNEDTKVKIPSMKNVTLEDIPLESQTAVQARADQTGALVARKIQVIPGKPTKIHRVGVVTAYTPGNSITIQAKDGGTTQFSLNADTKILPKKRAESLAVGDSVTIISRRNLTGGTPAAQGVVIHGGEDDGDD